MLFIDRCKGQLSALLVALLLAGCQSMPEQRRPPVPWQQSAVEPADAGALQKRWLVVGTRPEGGQLLLHPGGQPVAHGSRTQLEYGTYTLTAKKPGYRDGQLQVRVDGKSPSVITVPLGQGYAPVTLLTEPAGAAVSLAGKPLGNTPFSVELGADEHEMEITRQGYQPLRKTITVVAGEPQRVELKLRPTTPLAKLEITTSPGDALLRMDGHLIGHSPLTLSNIPAGEHRLYAELIESSYSRLSGEKVIHLKGGEHRRITLQLDRKETLFKERVASAAEQEPPVTVVAPAPEKQLSNADGPKLALAQPVLESAPPESLDTPGVADQVARQSSGQKTGPEAPVSPQKAEQPSPLIPPQSPRLSSADGSDPALTLALALDDQLRADLGNRQFVEGLLTLLRNGDGIELYRNRVKVAELRRGEKWRDGDFQRPLRMAGIALPLSNKSLSADERQRMAEILFGIYRQRGGYPLLELTREQNQQLRHRVNRVAADGEILIIGSGQGFGVEGYSPVSSGAGMSLFRLKAADQPIDIRWAQQPASVLVTAAASPPFAPLATGRELALREKQIFRLADKAIAQSVYEVTELSAGPEFRGWRWQHLARIDGVGFSGLEPIMEIGPHVRVGQYERAWVVRYQGPDGNSQRQLALAYQVGSRQQPVTSDDFLRRDGFSRYKQK